MHPEGSNRKHGVFGLPDQFGLFLTFGADLVYRKPTSARLRARLKFCGGIFDPPRRTRGGSFIDIRLAHRAQFRT
jgi:hypothetical protein